MLQVDMVAGDFNGAAWRRQSGNEHRHLSTVEEAFCQHVLTYSTWAPHLCGDQMLYQVNGLTFADLLLSQRGPRLSGIFACTVLSKSLTIRSASNLQTRAATTKAGFISCTSMRDWSIVYPGMTKSCRPISRKRNSPYDHSKEKRQSR